MTETTSDPCVQWLEAFAGLLDTRIPSIIEIHRYAQQFLRDGDAVAARRCERLIYLLHNSQVPAECRLPTGTRFAYGGIGVVLHASARLGHGVMIGQNVTIGGNGGKGKPDASGRAFAIPRIGNHVYIAAGARVLGGINIGDYTIVAANSVVLHDVPPFSVVAGNPASVRRTIHLENALRYKDFFLFGKNNEPHAYLEFIRAELARLR